MKNLTVSQFTANGAKTLANPVSNGYVQICVKQTIEQKNSGAVMSKRKSTLAGLMTFDAESWADISADMTEGANANEVLAKHGFEPQQLFQQFAFDHFYTRKDGTDQSPAMKYTPGTKNLVESLIDNKNYYRLTAFAPADAVVKNQWGSISVVNGKRKFVADESVNPNATAVVESEATVTNDAEAM